MNPAVNDTKPQQSSSRLETREVTFANEVLLPEIVKMMDEGHTVTLRLRGNSMRPFLEDNRDKALMRKAETEDVVVGAPVLAETANHHYVLHRIVKIEGDIVTLRGDGNIGVEVCRKGDVKGAITGFYRKGRNSLDRTDSRKWRLYSTVWCGLLPLRRYLLAFYRRIWIPLFGAV